MWAYRSFVKNASGTPLSGGDEGSGEVRWSSVVLPHILAQGPVAIAAQDDIVLLGKADKRSTPFARVSPSTL